MQKPLVGASGFVLSREAHAWWHLHGTPLGRAIQVEGEMADFTVDGFLVCYPVYALLQNPRNHGGKSLKIDGIAWIESAKGKAIALFTDHDLAERYLSLCGKPAGVVIAACDKGSVLLPIVLFARQLSFEWVVFDAVPAVNKTLRGFRIDAVIKAVQRGSNEEDDK